MIIKKSIVDLVSKIGKENIITICIGNNVITCSKNFIIIRLEIILHYENPYLD